MNYSISQVDPKQTIHVGSFRLNPDGTMQDKKVQYTDMQVNIHSPATMKLCLSGPVEA